jgi:hypothetical protein
MRGGGPCWVVLVLVVVFWALMRRRGTAVETSQRKMVRSRPEEAKLRLLLEQVRERMGWPWERYFWMGWLVVGVGVGVEVEVDVDVEVVEGRVRVR